MTINNIRCNQDAAAYKQKNSIEENSRKNFAQVFEQTKKERAQQGTALLCSAQLSGDYISSFEIHNPTLADMQAKPQGSAARALQCKDLQHNTIDKTTQLYQQALELESYFVKIMLNSMRSTLGNNFLTGKNTFAGKMYEDMMYEELSRTMTKNAGLGLADQIYIQLNGNT